MRWPSVFQIGQLGRNWRVVFGLTTIRHELIKLSFVLGAAFHLAAGFHQGIEKAVALFLGAGEGKASGRIVSLCNQPCFAVGSSKCGRDHVGQVFRGEKPGSFRDLTKLGGISSRC